MLLNEFLKEHRKVEQQEAKLEKQQSINDELKARMVEQQKQIEALAAIVQTVRDGLQLKKPVP
jgi:hypothetical protein